MSTAVTPSSGKGYGALRGLLEKSKNEIALALPKHLTPERMIRVALTCYNKTPELANCDTMSIVACVFQASQLGLEFDGVLGHAYLVPFKGKAQLIVGYKGYLALARRSGEVAAFFAHVVHANDRFDFRYGTSPFLEHVPVMKGRGEPVAVYGVIKLKDGSSDFEVLTWEEILACQKKFCRTNRSGQMYGPWLDHLEEMARKTAIRRLAKRCPVSVEVQRAASLDEHADAGVDQQLDLPRGLPSRGDGIAALLQQQAEADPRRDLFDEIDSLCITLGVGEDQLAKYLPRGVAQADLSVEQCEGILATLRAEMEEKEAGAGESAPET